jgi:hypothetical protein
MESQRLLVQLMRGGLMLEEPKQQNRQIFHMIPADGGVDVEGG